jgi:hypothetical protein
VTTGERPVAGDGHARHSLAARRNHLQWCHWPTVGFQTLEQTLMAPVGVAQVRVVLTGFSPVDPVTRGTVTFDAVGLYAH